MLGVISILFTLAALMYFAYRGVTVLVLAPLLAMLAALISQELPTLYALSNVFMPAAANYIKLYFPVFLAGAIFGKLMGVTGAATSIAHFISKRFGTKSAVFTIVMATALLTYGGVSLFVVVFAMYPIGATVLRDAKIPKRLLPACIVCGAFTFTMTAMPGTPQYINTMPTVYFGTDIYAAPILGIFASIIMGGGGILWLSRRAKIALAAGEGYGEHGEEGLGSDDKPLPGFVWSITPILIVFILNFIFTNVYFKMESVIADYAAFDIKPNGTWPVILSLAVAIVLILIVLRKYLSKPNATVFDGAVGGLLPIFNTASEVGYGGVIKSLAAFATVRAGMAALNIVPILKVAISATALAGIVGSSSGGTAIALEILADEFLATGINPEVLHRVMLIAAGGLDTLPHCGAVITVLSVCKLTHQAKLQ